MLRTGVRLSGDASPYRWSAGTLRPTCGSAGTLRPTSILHFPISIPHSSVMQSSIPRSTGVVGLCSLLCIFAVASLFQPGVRAAESEPAGNRPERLEWFRDQGFGLFIHWSADSQSRVGDQPFDGGRFGGVSPAVHSRASRGRLTRGSSSRATGRFWRGWRASNTWSSPRNTIPAFACSRPRPRRSTS